MYYEVEDEDPGDEHDPNPIRKHFHLPAAAVIPLPTDSDEDRPREHRRGSHVLAMFPLTTSFYQAVVVQPKKGEEYVLNFHDDEDDSGQTPARVVEAKFVVSPGDTMANG